jgi:hypothetical protein
MSGRPRTVIGTFGEVHVHRLATSRYRASTRYRDVDGRPATGDGDGSERSGCDLAA